MKLNCDINTNVRSHLTQYVCAGLFCFFVDLTQAMVFWEEGMSIKESDRPVD